MNRRKAATWLTMVRADLEHISDINWSGKVRAALGIILLAKIPRGETHRPLLVAKNLPENSRRRQTRRERRAQ